mmetsp:Transcript_35189/g.79413  ORF Transcript_35189/g.79413 Transcript_35189/m.79413 type:complete len:408 (+) Transcript_35189:290-1513(+)
MEEKSSLWPPGLRIMAPNFHNGWQGATHETTVIADLASLSLPNKEKYHFVWWSLHQYYEPLLLGDMETKPTWEKEKGTQSIQIKIGEEMWRARVLSAQDASEAGLVLDDFVVLKWEDDSSIEIGARSKSQGSPRVQPIFPGRPSEESESRTPGEGYELEPDQRTGRKPRCLARKGSCKGTSDDGDPETRGSSTSFAFGPSLDAAPWRRYPDDTEDDAEDDGVDDAEDDCGDDGGDDADGLLGINGAHHDGASRGASFQGASTSRRETKRDPPLLSPGRQKRRTLADRSSPSRGTVLGWNRDDRGSDHESASTVAPSSVEASLPESGSDKVPAQKSIEEWLSNIRKEFAMYAPYFENAGIEDVEMLKLTDSGDLAEFVEELQILGKMKRFHSKVIIKRASEFKDRHFK